MITDSHVHYSHRRFDGEFECLSCDNGGSYVLEAAGGREALIDDLIENGYDTFLEPAIDLHSNVSIGELCRRYPENFFAGVGVHPTRVHREKWRSRKKLKVFLEEKNVVAVGETGLDYHYKRISQHRLCQYMWFIYQLRLAHERALPLVLHIRMADRDALRILRRYKDRLHGGVVHCFCSGADVAKAYTDLGLCLGIGGMLLQSPERSAPLVEAVRTTPLDRILIETDSPYVHPDCRGVIKTKKLKKSCNTSYILPRVVERIAEIKGVSEEDVIKATRENTVRVFSLSNR